MIARTRRRFLVGLILCSLFLLLNIFLFFNKSRSLQNLEVLPSITKKPHVSFSRNTLKPITFFKSFKESSTKIEPSSNGPSLKTYKKHHPTHAIELNNTRSSQSLKGECKLLSPSKLPYYNEKKSVQTSLLIETCSSEPFLMTKVVNHTIVYVNEWKMEDEEVSCCLNSTVRVESEKIVNGTKVKTKKDQKVCVLIPESGTPLNDTDFPFVTCTSKSKHSNVSQVQMEQNFNFIKFKGRTKSKYEYWRNLKVLNLAQPMSILILGISSVSLTELRHSLQRTRRMLLKQLDFTEFTHLISSGQGISESLAQILTGDQLENCLFRNGTNVKRKDSCLYLPQFYNELNFITFTSVQDEELLSTNVFSGFNDYSFYTLLKRYTGGMLRESKHECFQHHMLQKLLNYTSEFLYEYRHTPYFSTIWLDLFNAQIPNALQVTDDVLSSFFKQNFPHLTNTAVFFVSDAGVLDPLKMKAPSSLSPLDIINSLNYPPLFARLPPKFKLTSNSKNYFQKNKDKVITFRHIYNTLHKNLKDTCNDILVEEDIKIIGKLKKTCESLLLDDKHTVNITFENSEQFKPLWEQIAFFRTCSRSGILPHYCFCNLDLNKPVASTPDFMHENSTKFEISQEKIEDAAIFLVNKLNDYIDGSFSSKERVLCAHWVLEFNGIHYNKTVVSYEEMKINVGLYNKTELFERRDLFLIIKAQPNDVNEILDQISSFFFGRVRLSDDLTEMELVGFPIRIYSEGEFGKKYSRCALRYKDPKLMDICYCSKGANKPYYEKMPLY